MSDTSLIGNPASRIDFAVPPLPIKLNPSSTKDLANGSRSVLSDTLNRAVKFIKKNSKFWILLNYFRTPQIIPIFVGAILVYEILGSWLIGWTYIWCEQNGYGVWTESKMNRVIDAYSGEEYYCDIWLRINGKVNNSFEADNNVLLSCVV